MTAVDAQTADAIKMLEAAIHDKSAELMSRILRDNLTTLQAMDAFYEIVINAVDDALKRPRRTLAARSPAT